MTLNIGNTWALFGGKYMCPSLERQYRRTRSLNRLLNTEDESPISFKMTMPSDDDPCFDFFVGEHGNSDDVSDWVSPRDLTRSSKPAIRSLSFSKIAFTSSFLSVTWVKTLETTVCNREEISCCRRSSKVPSESPRRAPPRPLLPLPLSIGSQRKVVLQPAEKLWTVGVMISRRLYSRPKCLLAPIVIWYQTAVVTISSIFVDAKHKSERKLRSFNNRFLGERHKFHYHNKTTSTIQPTLNHLTPFPNFPNKNKAETSLLQVIRTSIHWTTTTNTPTTVATLLKNLCSTQFLIQTTSQMTLVCRHFFHKLE